MRIKNNFKLYVECMTYNQHQYITDAIDGFVMQQTTFPYVCCIIDDASTDGEQLVIKEYLCNHLDFSVEESIFDFETEYGYVSYAQHKDNKECYFLVILLKENHYQKGRSTDKLKYIEEWIGKPQYVAYCEGDDYWIYPEKLQKQISYLDIHPEIVVSCHRCYIREELESGDKTYLRPIDEDESVFGKGDVFEYDFETFFENGRWINETNATVIRNIYEPDIIWEGCKYKTRDVHMIFYMLKQGNGVCHSFIGGVYRHNKGGIFAQISNVKLATVQNEIYTEIYNVTHEPLLINSIVHYRFALLKNGKYTIPLDSMTIMAWRQYVLYLIRAAVHFLVPQKYRRSQK